MSIESPHAETSSTGSAPEVRRVRDAGELTAALAVRKRVFCEEQGVPSTDELDGRDSEGLHLVALINGTVVATCRTIFVGATAQFSRLAVEKEFRRQGIATLLLNQAEVESRAAKARRMVLHAQTYAMDLYESVGYNSRGSVFRDAGIDHVAMEKRLA